MSTEKLIDELSAALEKAEKERDELQESYHGLEAEVISLKETATNLATELADAVEAREAYGVKMNGMKARLVSTAFSVAKLEVVLTQLSEAVGVGALAISGDNRVPDALDTAYKALNSTDTTTLADRADISFWRDDALQKAADIVARYFEHEDEMARRIVMDIKALMSDEFVSDKSSRCR